MKKPKRKKRRTGKNDGNDEKVVLWRPKVIPRIPLKRSAKTLIKLLVIIAIRKATISRIAPS